MSKTLTGVIIVFSLSVLLTVVVCSVRQYFVRRRGRKALERLEHSQMFSEYRYKYKNIRED